jgi:hypothetical protein
MIPKYTIFIPSFCGDNYIKNFCNNILIQTDKPDQIVIVDDGKNSNNFLMEVKKCLKELKNTEKLFFKNNTNLKPAKTWNTYKKFFRNKLILRMDVDDCWRENHAHTMLSAYEADPTCLLYYQEVKGPKNFLYNSEQVFVNLAIHSSCLFNMNIWDFSYPILNKYPYDDLLAIFKIKFLLKKKIKILKKTTVHVNIARLGRYSSNQSKASIFFLKKLFFMFLKKKLSVKKIKLIYFYKIFYHFNIFQSIYIMYKIFFK